MCALAVLPACHSGNEPGTVQKLRVEVRDLHSLGRSGMLYST